MVTGDNEVTAAAIAKQCGILSPAAGDLAPGVVLTGKVFRQKYAPQIAALKAATTAKTGISFTKSVKKLVDQDGAAGADGSGQDGEALKLDDQVVRELKALRVPLAIHLRQNVLPSECAWRFTSTVI